MCEMYMCLKQTKQNVWIPQNADMKKLDQRGDGKNSAPQFNGFSA